ncbi:MAG: hypothetical protein IJ561_06045 [Ruminococcus sp.]|nr:hypothetical protein [Ruminococcus sp.]
MIRRLLVMTAGLSLMLLSGCGEAIGTAESVPLRQETAAPVTSASSLTAQTPAESSVTTQISDDSSEEEPGLLSSAEEIDLRDTDGAGTEYLFTYGGEDFRAVYTPDNWKIVSSYRITSKADMYFICQALIAEHPLHGSDGVSFRTPEDMVFEWSEHNWVYYMLPEDSPWRVNTGDVDFNPEDQGKTAIDMARDRLKEKYG